ncbi:isopentenyl-diphosphate Delta-isomerase [Thalassotalea mangrovi]|uniref:isopentenyl-diphosphate Delta-isomerase n=1 Tax=Thalassotalea mangrovi TaxID=2572245 RepID=UPI001B802E5C|nr:isopentenyl-diphosphate Delta-isomerase [Thalassotalea mangrovi]
MDDRQEQVVLANESGKPVGLKGKLQAHLDGDLHLAFSVMLFRLTNQGIEYLLQRRARHKYHSGGLWSNTVCSHPRDGESITQAATRRIDEELGIVQPLNFTGIGHIIYKARLDNHLTEHEYDHILICECPTLEFSANPDEVMDCRWWSETQIDNALNQSSKQFTAWFNEVYNKTREVVGESIY